MEGDQRAQKHRISQHSSVLASVEGDLAKALTFAAIQAPSDLQSAADPRRGSDEDEDEEDTLSETLANTTSLTTLRSVACDSKQSKTEGQQYQIDQSQTIGEKSKVSSRVRIVISVPYVWFGIVFGIAPILVALTLCLVIATSYHKENTVHTHCNVDNWLPSISAAIGNNFPEAAIWRTGVALILLQRLLDIFIYYQLHTYTTPRALLKPAQSHRLLVYKTTNIIRTLFAIAEVVCLTLLTNVTSTEHFVVHEMGFIGFVLAAFISSFLQLVLFNMKNQSPEKSETCETSEHHHTHNPFSTSYSLKVKAFTIQLGAAASAAYMYVRHEKYCEPGMYSLFALCEYILVISNIFFHFTLWWEIPKTTMGFSLDLPGSAVTGLDTRTLRDSHLKGEFSQHIIIEDYERLQVIS